MCSRYSLTSPPEAVRATFAYRDTPNFPVRYNIAPTQDIGVVCLDADGQRRFRMMRWGCCRGSSRIRRQGPPMINARAEGISTKSAFRRAFAERRCFVPADGFYEWTGPKGARRPFLLRPREGGMIAFAAIWERWRDREGGEIDTVAIITCDANATVASLHDRMPVALGQEHFEVWLDFKTTEVKAAQELLQSAPDDLLEAIEMHPQINDSRRDEPGIQQPLQTQLLL